MQVQKFLVRAVIYLSIAGSGASFADDRDTERKVGASETRTYTVGNDKLRFSVKERAALERYSSSERTERYEHDVDEADRDGKRDKAGKHKDGKHKPLPPGLQKKAARGEELPPGWQTKIARGEVMPETIYAAGVPLTAETRKQWRLPADPKGTVTIDVDGEIVRVVQATREIIDILRGNR